MSPDAGVIFLDMRLEFARPFPRGAPATELTAGELRIGRLWWDITIAGFGAEGIAVYESDGATFTEEFDAFAAAVGFGDGAGLEEFVRVEQWAGIDHNNNGLVCMKRRPVTPGNPAYFFNGVDDLAFSPLSVGG